jgi:hypothetical protein
VPLDALPSRVSTDGAGLVYSSTPVRSAPPTEMIGTGGCMATTSIVSVRSVGPASESRCNEIVLGPPEANRWVVEISVPAWLGPGTQVEV